MAAKNIMHMNVGDGETSYANNSTLQKAVTSKSFQVLDNTLEYIVINDDHIDLNKCFKMVDLGCSSGPNTLSAMSRVMNKFKDLCKQKNIFNNDDIPEFEIFLNDLPDNDFNILFKLLRLHDQNGKDRKNCFIYGLPGSFYGRLLPKGSVHFAYSFCSVHWLSQIPEGLENKNKENIYMAMTSPAEVYEAYAKQYQRDFYTFLSSRAEEIIPGGHMVLTFVSRSVEDPSITDDYNATYTLLAKMLLDMVAEELVKMDDLYSFNVPIYHPHTKEVEAAIKTEGSFTLIKMDVFLVPWDANDDNDNDNNHDELDQQDPSILYKQESGKVVADCVRAFMEPMLAKHFGSSIIDDLFRRYGNKAAEYLTANKSTCINMVISLKRR